MMKLRRFWPDEKLREIYSRTYEPGQWLEHRVRIAATIRIAQRLIDDHGLKTCADFSAGDRQIVSGLRNLEMLETSDFTGGHHIERRVETMSPIDLFILTETIEHLETPWTILEKLAPHVTWLVLSTPLDESREIGNYEHYWSFTRDDVETMLYQSGFDDLTPTILHEPGWTYTYQIWTAKSEVKT